MTEGSLQFELVSPEKLMVSKTAAMVTVPGGEGDYGVLIGHAPMITTVRPGVIEIYADENVSASERIFVAGGFAEVTPTRCTVLADEAVAVATLDRGQLEDTLRELNAKIAMSPETEKESLFTQQAILAAKIQAAA